MFRAVERLPAGKVISFRLTGLFFAGFFALFAYSGAGLFLAGNGWSASPTWWNILTYPLGLWELRIFFLSLALSGVALILDFRARAAALFLAYGLASLASVELDLSESHWAFLGWLLLFRIFYSGEPRQFLKFQWVAWLVFGASFSVGGYSKLVGGEWWRSGNAIYLYLQSLDSSPVKDFLQQQPSLLKVLSWLVLFFELFALPLVLFRRSRPVVLSVFSGMHLVLLFALGWNVLQAISLAMLIFYFFLYEISWKRA